MDNNIPEHELLMMTATEETILRGICICQEWVMKVVPHATLMYGTNKRGEINSIAIYDCKIVLNHNGHIDAKNSESPQRISELFTYSANYSKPNHIGVLKLKFEVWMTALHRQMAIGNIQWYKFNKV